MVAALSIGWSIAMLEKLLCPVCGQDWVTRAKLRGTQTAFWVCPECESVWLSRESIGADAGEFLGNVLKWHGREDLFSEIELLDI